MKEFTQLKAAADAHSLAQLKAHPGVVQLGGKDSKETGERTTNLEGQLEPTEESSSETDQMSVQKGPTTLPDSDEMEVFRASLKDWRFGKGQKTWDEYYESLKVSKTYGGDYDQFLQEAYEHHMRLYPESTLTLGQVHSIFSLTTIFHQKELNKKLREGSDEEKVKDAAEFHDKSIGSLPPVEAKRTLYRGINLKEAELEEFAQYKTGDEITNPDYIFTATNQGSFYNDANVQFVLYTKEGGKGREIYDMSFGKMHEGKENVVSTEKETIFQRGSKFEVMDVEVEKEGGATKKVKLYLLEI